MAGIVDVCTKKVQNICNKGRNIWSSGSNPDNNQVANEVEHKQERGSYEEAVAAASLPTGTRFLRLNPSPGFHYSDTSVDMVVECFSP
ncbi:hypothetical protein AG4045_012287 [Apium graveolens]|uniref:Uncharacterized protein n=1 Tax=Apium graveolens TaxID=4045 RepID=A0A6L5BBM0_APIGR|nr:hypothetical protein AG4045_012287 [Apium graveolens]